jgi:hypothetical protein
MLSMLPVLRRISPLDGHVANDGVVTSNTVKKETTHRGYREGRRRRNMANSSGGGWT